MRDALLPLIFLRILVSFLNNERKSTESQNS